MPVARVLVVDDEPDLRQLVRVSLSLAGHDVSLASDGRSGLLYAKQHHPDVVLLDVMMPGMDGWGVLAALKSDPEPTVAMIPVVMLTARTEALDVVRGGIEGAVRYLTKPFGIDELHRAVAEAVAGQPEPEQRRAAQRAALVHLARLERGTVSAGPAGANPRMSRLEPVSGAHAARAGAPAGHDWPSWLGIDILSPRDQEILSTVTASPTLAEARAHLQVSRSYLYARLRRIAGKLDFESGPALVQALRAARAVPGRQVRRSGSPVPTGR